MKSIAVFVMRGRSAAVLIAAPTAVLFWLFLPLLIVSGAVVALVTLRRARPKAHCSRCWPGWVPARWPDWCWVWRNVADAVGGAGLLDPLMGTGVAVASHGIAVRDAASRRPAGFAGRGWILPGAGRPGGLVEPDA